MWYNEALQATLEDYERRAMTVKDLPHYVYQLEYEDGVPFYIGVGVKDRVSTHRRMARRDAHPNSAMNDAIRQAEVDGNRVVQRLLARFANREDALDYEKRMIARTPGLLNIRRYKMPVEPVDVQTPVTPISREQVKAVLDEYYAVFRSVG